MSAGVGVGKCTCSEDDDDFGAHHSTRCPNYRPALSVTRSTKRCSCSRVVVHAKMHANGARADRAGHHIGDQAAQAYQVKHSAGRARMLEIAAAFHIAADLKAKVKMPAQERDFRVVAESFEREAAELPANS